MQLETRNAQRGRYRFHISLLLERIRSIPYFALRDYTQRKSKSTITYAARKQSISLENKNTLRKQRDATLN